MALGVRFQDEFAEFFFAIRWEPSVDDRAQGRAQHTVSVVGLVPKQCTAKMTVEFVDPECTQSTTRPANASLGSLSCQILFFSTVKIERNLYFPAHWKNASKRRCSLQILLRHLTFLFQARKWGDFFQCKGVKICHAQRGGENLLIFAVQTTQIVLGPVRFFWLLFLSDFVHFNCQNQAQFVRRLSVWLFPAHGIFFWHL